MNQSKTPKEVLGSDRSGDNKLVIRFDKLMKKFQIRFGSIMKRATKKNIHQLRVNIKKIRAVLRLLERTSQGSFNKAPHFELYSSLFRTAGYVREAQVNGSVISKYTNNEGLSYKDYLLDIESRSREQLSEEIRKFDTGKLEVLNKNLHLKAREISDKNIEQEASQYITHNLQTIIQLRHKLQKLHRIRKVVRTLSEVLKYVDYRLSGDHDPTHLYYVVDKLNTMIGQWHDCQVLVDSIKFFDPTDKKSYKKIILKIEADRSRKKEEIYRFMDKNLERSLVTS